MSDNVLSKYHRQPAIHIKLPSQGKYWKDDSLVISPNNEYPVLPMTGKDDISLRNADGLMNGASTVSVFQSCIPNIKNAWEMPSIDIDVAMIAIRIASYGPGMEFTTKCTKCNEELDYTADLTEIMNSIQYPNFDEAVEVNDLLVWFKPISYQKINAASLDEYVQQKTIQALNNIELTEEQKISQFKAAVRTLTLATVDRVASYIDKIITPSGEKVTDPEIISDFVNNADRKSFTALREAISKLNESYKIQPIKIKCSCGHEDVRNFQFDPSNFFE